MSKKILGLAIAILLLFSALPISAAASADDAAIDAADAYFTQFVLSDCEFDGELTYTHTPLYNADLQPHGREYTFSIGEKQGYALMIELCGTTQVFYEIEELFYDAVSPFADCDGLPVYVNHRVYLEYKDNDFYNAQSGAAVTEEYVEEQAALAFNYYGSGTSTTVTQTVTYSTKNTETYSFPNDLPEYGGAANSSSCASVAGTTILAYYDIQYEDLIPNCQVYTIFLGAFVYGAQPAEITALTADLHDLMLIGEEHDGRTFTEYQHGMSTYVTGKGFSYSTTSVFTNGSFDFSKYKTAVESGKPVAIFCSGFALLGTTTVNEGNDVIESQYNTATHVVVGCGYKIDRYYDADGNLSDTRTYLKIASGLVTCGIGYLNINGIGTIDRAIATTIS